MVDFVRVNKAGQKLSSQECRGLMIGLVAEMKKQGYVSMTKVKAPTACSFSMSDFRLSQKLVDKEGFNISPFTGRRGRILGWEDWVKVNNAINRVMDKKKVEAKVSSLGGKFMIREGKRAFKRRDREPLGYENVGSMMNPVQRRDAWHRERR